jgi:predicted outer membrane lipoprotein
MTIAVPDPARHGAYKTGATALLLAAAAILGALAFEHLGKAAIGSQQCATHLRLFVVPA